MTAEARPSAATHLQDESTVVPLDRLHPRPRVARLRGPFRYVLWRRPRRLDEASRDWIYRTLVTVSTRAFGADMAPYWRDRRSGGYLSSVSRFALIVDDSDRMVGWTGLHLRSFGGKRCIFLDSTGVVPELQECGLVGAVQSRLLMRELVKRPWSTVHLVMRTESPIVYTAFRRALGEDCIHPAPGRTVPAPVQRIGSDAAEWLGQSAAFRAERLKIEGAYSNLDALYGDLPSTGDGELDSFFREALTPVDAFLIVCEASAARVLRYRLRRRARRLQARRA